MTHEEIFKEIHAVAHQASGVVHKIQRLSVFVQNDLGMMLEDKHITVEGIRQAKQDMIQETENIPEEFFKVYERLLKAQKEAIALMDSYTVEK